MLTAIACVLAITLVGYRHHRKTTHSRNRTVRW